MLKVMATNVVVSKGYNGAPALKFSEKGDSVRLRIGKKVYDSREEGNHRWVNFAVKAFGDVCERITKMKIKEGSYINITGRLDEEAWNDKETGAERKQTVIIIDDIEYASSAKSGENQNQSGGGQSGGQGQEGTQYQQASAFPAQGIVMQGMGPMPQVAQMQPVMQGMPQAAPAAQMAPAQMTGQPQRQSQQMAQGQPMGQPQMQQMPQNQPVYNGFTGFEAYGGNNLFAE